MDCNKLPLAHDLNILYMYKHPNSIKHIQSIYNADYTVNPRNIIKSVIPREKIIEDKKKEIKAKVSVCSFIVEDTTTNTTNTPSTNNETVAISGAVAACEISESNTPETTPETGQLTAPETETETDTEKITIDSWRFMVSNIDDVSSLYTENMWRDAIDLMKQKLIILMTSGAGHKKYGPKKSRTILAWLTDNKRGTPASTETALVIADFISWFLDIKVSSVETTKLNAPWIMFRKRGVWMIRNNV